jgi:predicted ATPase
MLVDRNISVPGAVVSMQFAEQGMDKRVIDFLSKVGTGVVDFHRTESEIPDNLRSFQKAFADLIKKHFEEDSEPPEWRKHFSVELAHRSRDGIKVFFDLEDESAGTLRLLMLVAAAYTALDEGSLLLIDGLDASLHTQACEAVLALFSSAQANRKGAQLIATTHDTNLLRSRFLRRDQIWFTEKDFEGATHLYPLTDFRTRTGDNVEKGYLQGRYGAIPFSGSVSELFGV